MKLKILLILLIVAIYVSAVEIPNLTTFSNFSDKQNISFSTGIASNFNNSISYSLLSYNGSKFLNTNWSMNYNIDYLNINRVNNYVNTGIGLNYHNDKFTFNLYLSKTFDAEDFYKNKYFSSIK